MPRNDQIGLLEYLSGAGKEYPSIAALMRVIMASQAKQEMDRLKPESVREFAGRAREGISGTVGVESREPRAARKPVMAPQPEPTLMERELAGEDVYAFNPQREAAAAAATPGFSIDVGYGSTSAPPSGRGGGSRGRAADEIWRRFQEMNPDLDYEAVARQSGGNVPGGSFSDMRLSPGVKSVKESTPGASDEAFYQWVKDFTYEQDLARKMDPRSRAYDPRGAELMISEREGEREAANTAESNAIAKIYALARQAEVENTVSETARRMQLESSPAGQVRVLAASLLNAADPTTEGHVRDAAMRAIVLAEQGDVQGAWLLLNSISAQSADQEEVNKSGDPRIG